MSLQEPLRIRREPPDHLHVRLDPDPAAVKRPFRGKLDVISSPVIRSPAICSQVICSPVKPLLNVLTEKLVFIIAILSSVTIVT